MCLRNRNLPGRGALGGEPMLELRWKSGCRTVEHSAATFSAVEVIYFQIRSISCLGVLGVLKSGRICLVG